ncbi:MAG TPA: hypothetical protein VGB78_05540 [Thermoplasmata archaeon]
MRKGIVAIGAVLTLFFVPFTLYALALNDSPPSDPEDPSSSPGVVAVLAVFATIGLVILIIGIAPSEKRKKPKDWTIFDDE